MTLFLRLLAETDKAAALAEVCRRQRAEGGDPRVFEVAPEAFDAVPGKPFAYWVSNAVRETFQRLPTFDSEGRTARRGPSTCDDLRYLRLFWEIDVNHFHGYGEWRPFSKGGVFSRFYSDIYLAVDWEPRRSTFLGFFGRPGREIERPESVDSFFRPGLTWPRRTTSGLSLRVMPSGCIFADKGPAAFVADDDPDGLLALLAITNSRAFGLLVSLQLAAADAAARSYEVGVIQKTPVPLLPAAVRLLLAQHARRAWSLKRSLDTLNETSHAFLLPPSLNEQITGLDAGAIERELATIQKQIDETTFNLYGIRPEDTAPIQGSGEEMDVAGDDEGDEASGDDTNLTPDSWHLTSWLVGVVFGRFDPRLATGERSIPPEPEPFDPLPARSPGMYPEGEEPADRPDILVDDPGHADDLAARAITIAERVKVDVPENLRGWLAKEFFPLHIKMYSKSRRKAPIYWQLATPSAGYSVWLYIHAFSKDTLFRVQNDYVAPKLAHEERRLVGAYGHTPLQKATAAQRKQLAAQEGLVEELRAFLDEVKRVAPLWKPNLDDGVVINFAPLWRLVPQNKSWQKELKSTWDALCEGKYDWAHLAMHLWPERVVPKCAKDRSLAIAHGLEDVFWVEGGDGKWTARKQPTRSVDELVKERTSPAVKSALKSLLEAPAAAGTGRKTKKG